MSSVLRVTAQRYRQWPNLYYYAQGKLALDPAYPVVAKELASSPRPLLDIGCGMGLLAAWLRAHGHRAAITGLDVDGEKIRIAQNLLGSENASFHTGDALDFAPHAGDVVMLDVLHYFDDAQQQRLLEKIAASVAPGGVAMIRVTLNDKSWRFTVTKLEEWFVHASGWIPTTGWNFPTRDEIGGAFRAAGLTEESRPMWGITPFNSYLFTFRRCEAA
jgi:2-polyprenyl-3-methyl-5-hydroxy-6-metoxy-1,4-benzoquinol methylase